MEMPLIRAGKIAFAALAAIIAVSVPASAAKPRRAPYSFNDTIPAITQCSYGSLELNWIGTGFNTFFFDSAGNLTRIASQDWFTLTFTNPLNGKSASGTNRQNQTQDVGANKLIIRGVTTFLDLPDGTKYRFAGRYIVDYSTGSFTISSQTPNAIPDAAADAALCAALE